MMDSRFQPRHRVIGSTGFKPLVTHGALGQGFVHYALTDLLRKPPADAGRAIEPEAAPEPQETQHVHIAAPKPTERVKPDNAVLEAEFERGVAKGRADVEAGIGSSRAQLETAAVALTSMLDQIGLAVEDETIALAEVLQQSVRILASERAGLAISHDPASFAHRITGLAERISDCFTKLSVRVNPADLEALRTLRDPVGLPELERLFEAELLPDPSLLRGDIRLRAAGIALDDLICAAPER